MTTRPLTKEVLKKMFLKAHWRPDAMDSQLKKAGALAAELLKLLTGLPRPWNRRFHVFNRALRGLIDKLDGIS